MIIIGCDYHPGFQQIALVDTDTGEVKERKLRHREEAEEFYRQLKVSGKQVRVFCPVLSSQCGSLDPSLRYE